MLGTGLVGTIGGGRPVPVPGREGGAGGALPPLESGRLGTAGAGRPDTGGAGGAREADDPMEGPGPIADPVTGRRGPPGEGGDARCWLMLPSQSSFTGGGMGVDTVAMDTSPMIRSASLHAWYMRSISSRLTASSALSSIIEFCVPNRSQITNSVDSFSGRDLALTRAPARGHANTNTQRSGMKQGHKSSA